MTQLTKRHASWIVPVVLGMLTVSLCGLLYYKTHSPINTQLQQEARELGADPVKYTDLDSLDHKLFNRPPLSSEEWRRYTSYVNGTDLALKRQIARHLCATQGSEYEQQAHTLTNILIRDSDPQTRANALISLRKFNDPEWKDIAKQFLTDASEPPRKMGASMLEQEDKKR